MDVSPKTKLMQTPWAIVLLLFRPSRLVDLAVEEAMCAQPSKPSVEKEAKLRSMYRNQFQDSVSLIRNSFFLALGVVLIAIAGAVITASFLHLRDVPKSDRWNIGLQFGGIGILLWATLGRVESAVQTIDGGSLPERVDLWLYRALYVAGSYVLALSVVW